MQLRRHSLLEIITNVVVGFVIAFVIQVILFPYFGMHINTESHLMISGIFTIVSIVRGYTLRRIFNFHTIKTYKGE